MVFLRRQARQQLSDQRLVAEGTCQLGQEANFCQVPTEVLHRSSPHLTHKVCVLNFLSLRVELHKRKALEQSELEQERRYEDLRQKKVALDQNFQRVKAQLLVRIFAASLLQFNSKEPVIVFHSSNLFVFPLGGRRKLHGGVGSLGPGLSPLFRR